MSDHEKELVDFYRRWEANDKRRYFFSRNTWVRHPMMYADPFKTLEDLNAKKIPYQIWRGIKYPRALKGDVFNVYQPGRQASLTAIALGSGKFLIFSNAWSKARPIR